MYWARRLERKQLVNGNCFAHGISRLNLSATDLTTFVDAPDAALMFGFRALEAGDPFEESVVIWFATLRRRAGNDAIVESLQRVFTQMADEGSLARLLLETAAQAKRFGYEKLWLVPALAKEPLFVPALKVTAKELKQSVQVVPSSGMAAFNL
jgi:hypothetical protein